MIRRTVISVCLLLALAGCQRATLTKVVTRTGVVVGELVATRPDAIVVRRTDGTEIVISRSDVVSIEAATSVEIAGGGKPATPPPSAAPSGPATTPANSNPRPAVPDGPPDGGQTAGSIVLPTGTKLTLSLSSALASDTSQPGQVTTAVLSAPLVANGKVLLAAGTNVRGTVIAAGRVDGRSRLLVRFDAIVLSGRDVRLDVGDTIWRGTLVQKKSSGGTGLGGKFKDLVSKTKTGLHIGETVSLDVRLAVGTPVTITLASPLTVPL